MDNLLTTLDKMQDVLTSLTRIIEEEQQQLSAGQIDGHLLQRITEDKAALLTTLNYLDEVRLTAGRSLGLQAPYSDRQDMAARWTAIAATTRQLHNANQHNGLLLQHQVAFTQRALAVLKPHHTQAFYGPDGRGLGQSTLHSRG